MRFDFMSLTRKPRMYRRSPCSRWGEGVYPDRARQATDHSSDIAVLLPIKAHRPHLCRKQRAPTTLTNVVTINAKL